MPAEQLEQLFQVLEGGAEVAAGEIVQFPTDVAAQSGGLGTEGITTVVQMSNGAAAEVSQVTATAAGASTATTSGLGIMAIDVGVAGAAVAPALGVVAGVGLYNLAPEFWTNVSNELMNAGQTIGGKVRAFLNPETKEVGLSQQTIEIIKNALLQAGVFEYSETWDEQLPASTWVAQSPIYKGNSYLTDPRPEENYPEIYLGSGMCGDTPVIMTMYTSYMTLPSDLIVSSSVVNGVLYYIFTRRSSFSSYATLVFNKLTNRLVTAYSQLRTDTYTYNGLTVYYHVGSCWDETADDSIGTAPYDFTNSDAIKQLAWLLQYGNFLRDGDYELQPDAVLPSQDPISQTYPSWQPWQPTPPVVYPQELPNIYPIEMPVNNPTPDQDDAQNPNPNPDPSPFLEWIIQNLPQPDPNPNPQPEPVPEPDPDPQPEPEPIPDPGEDPIDPDPPDPNPDPPTPPLPIVPDLPATVDSNAMFTVYAPSVSQLNAFGGWLWDSNIIEQILRMWQNPLDGVIALMKVYATPTTGTAVPIQVGYLQSDASAPVVTSQFATVNCGTVSVPETKKNATDYSPYVSLHLYLPFIGIVELDTDEFMNGSITVTYTIDMYTGTCLAEVKCTRSVDMPNATILYTFSGNASQQLPVTSSNFAGALSSLVSAVGAGITIASGGAVAGIAGGIALGHSLTHEMVHVGHSGSLSANAGIMASRKPYLIISRRHGYDANNYATEYGFPANKAVYLGNCSGFTRVKACHLKTKASENEKEEIMTWLKKGVIL